MGTYSDEQLAALLPFPDSQAHKYSRGKLIALVGSGAYPGAACLAACASERMGAGYTEVFTHPCAVDLVRSSSHSLVVRSFEDFAQAVDSLSMTPSVPHRPIACVVGCGFDAGDLSAKSLVHQALLSFQAPVLIDGGALSFLVEVPFRSLLRRRFKQGFYTVITPHTGEASRLAAAFCLPTDNPFELSRLLANRYGVLVVLKGPTTYVSDGERAAWVDRGTSALAKAGTGDVLAGMIGALLSQNLDPFDASVLGAEVHALSGICASKESSLISVTAQDVVSFIPQALTMLQKCSASECFSFGA